MGDAGEGLIDADARIQERMEELERERSQAREGRVSQEDPEVVRGRESLRLAKLELEGQLATTTHERRKAQIGQALEEVTRRMKAMSVSR
ncbi:MAG: hypothetical protein ABL961_01185 [Vicinamibacterales bacterium]